MVCGYFNSDLIALHTNFKAVAVGALGVMSLLGHGLIKGQLRLLLISFQTWMNYPHPHMPNPFRRLDGMVIFKIFSIEITFLL